MTTVRFVGVGRMVGTIIQMEGGLNKQIILFFRSPTVHSQSLLYFRSGSYKRRDRVDCLV